MFLHRKHAFCSERTPLLTTVLKAIKKQKQYPVKVYSTDIIIQNSCNRYAGTISESIVIQVLTIIHGLNADAVPIKCVALVSVSKISKIQMEILVPSTGISI